MDIKLRTTDYIIVETCDRHVIPLFLGCKKLSEANTYRVEDNVLNRIILGLNRMDDHMTMQLIVDPPSHMFPYQLVDVEKLRRLRASLNANTMGLGKTLETVVLLRAIKGPILILCPKTVVPHWVAELEKFNIKAEAFPKKIPFRTKGVFVTNYEQMLNTTLQTTSKSFMWNAIVLDEAHRIKNRKSQISQVVESLPTIYKFALTGTPILNKPDDLWNILHWLSPKFSGKSYWNFVEYFCELEDGFFGKSIKGINRDPERQMFLQTLLNEFSVRNDAIPIAQGKIVTHVPLKMGPKQLKVYNNLRDLVLEELPPSIPFIANGMVLMTRMLQITSNPGRFIDDEAGIKFEWIAEFLDNGGKEPLVIFSKYSTAVADLQEYLEQRKIRCVRVIGEMSSKARVAGVEKFTKGAAQVLLGTIGAMGQGLDGLQHVCNRVVFLDREWSPSLQEQAEARLLRVGQALPVEVYYLECQHTVDMYVGKINLKKTEDIRRALGDENTSV